ncbi:MAG: hypothetical protein WCR58_06605 [Bacteroidales bacterium]|jgi:hypothetical protein|nr:hypothetical protein [Bacteroidales bacterium]MDD3702172.1 hypothetical protein [Bacteroidales bacterium]MDY0368954.1 hypothetical protein [Bacteroidales bacterium]
MTLWNKEVEIQFFREALKNFASPEQLFYNLKAGYFAYIPKGTSAEGQTLQSRNSLIGQFTEKWSKTIFEPIANSLGLYAINGVVCDEIGLSKMKLRQIIRIADRENTDITKAEKFLYFMVVPLSGRTIHYKSSHCGLFTTIPISSGKAA